jgi:hypothetical protein
MNSSWQYGDLRVSGDKRCNRLHGQEMAKMKTMEDNVTISRINASFHRESRTLASFNWQLHAD